MNKDKIKTMLGFASKSGNIITGNDFVHQSLGKKSVYLVLLGSDASKSNLEKIEKKCFRLNIPIASPLTTDEMSRAVGKNNRTVIGIVDEQFARRIYALIEA